MCSFLYRDGRHMVVLDNKKLEHLSCSTVLEPFQKSTMSFEDIPNRTAKGTNDEKL